MTTKPDLLPPVQKERSAMLIFMFLIGLWCGFMTAMVLSLKGWI